MHVEHAFLNEHQWKLSNKLQLNVQAKSVFWQWKNGPIELQLFTQPTIYTIEMDRSIDDVLLLLLFSQNSGKKVFCRLGTEELVIVATTRQSNQVYFIFESFERELT